MSSKVTVEHGAQSVSIPAWPWFVLVCVFGIALVFVIPYHLPVKPAFSASYVFGYNNAAGALLILLVCAVAAVWSRGTLMPQAKSLEVRPGIPRSWLWAGMVLCVFGCIVMYMLYGKLEGLNESAYDITRTWLLSQGLRPYRDFEWPFGAALLYLPLWTSRLFHISVSQGVYLVWTIATPVSLALLYAILNRLPGTSSSRRVVFVVFGITINLGTVLCMGLHYAGVRYLASLWFLLLIQERLHDVQTSSQLKLILLAWLSVTAQILISPEIAIALLFAEVVLLFPGCRLSGSRLSWLGYLGFLLGQVVLLCAAYKLHCLDALFTSGGGADSFPIVPCPLFFLYFVSLVQGMCIMVQRWRNPQPEDTRLPLVLSSIPMAVAALARADPGHMLINGLGVYLPVFAMLMGNARWRVYRYIVIVFFLLLPLVSYIHLFVVDLGFSAILAESEAVRTGQPLNWSGRSAWFVLDHLPPSSFRDKQMRRLRQASRFPVIGPYDFRAMYPEMDGAPGDGVLEAPFGFSPSTSTALYLSSQIDMGFYQGGENANTPEATARKIATLQAHPLRSLLMPGGSLLASPVVNAEEVRKSVSAIMLFPYTAKARHVEDVRAPLAEYIRMHYRQASPATPNNYNYELWMPLNVPAP